MVKSPKYEGYSTPEEIQKIYFKNYHYNFWLNKANALLTFIDHPERIKELKESDKSDKDEYILQNLKMEIHMMTFHSTESLFLTILAMIYEPNFPWIWITRTEKILHYVKLIGRKGLESLHPNPVELLRVNLYSSIGTKHTKYKESVESAVKVNQYLQRLAKNYLDHDEYNAYKHGLRGFPSKYNLPTGKQVDAMHYLYLKKPDEDDLQHKDDPIFVLQEQKEFDIDRDRRILMTNTAVLTSLFNKRRIDMEATPGNPKNFGYFLFHDINIDEIFMHGGEGGKKGFLKRYRY